MKKFFFITGLLTYTLGSVFGQAPNWEWGRTASNPTTENSICVDASGNSYVTGFFQNTVTFGTITLTSNADSPNPNLYIVKYNPWGVVVWAQNAGGHSDNEGWGVAVDDSANVYLTGFFNDTIVFGSTTLIAPGFYGPGFLVKYSPIGNVIWAKALGTGNGTFGTSPQSVTTDHSGNVFVTGYFRSPSATFDSFTLTSPDNGASEDIFLVKCNSSGNVLWAKMAGSTSAAISNCVTTDATGNSYVTGWFTSPSLTFGSSTIASNGVINCFLARYDPNGNVVWARGFGGSISNGGDGDYSNSVSADAAGYCYVTGAMNSQSMTIGSYTITNSDPNYDTPDLFLIKFAPNGAVMWAISAGDSNAFDVGNAVVSDNAGNAYLTGYFEGSSITFDSATSNTANGYSNIFVAKFAPSGNTMWIKAVGDTGNAEGTSIDINNSGDCYITGYFNGPSIAFGSIILSNPLMYGQFYIAKTGQESGIHNPQNSGSEISIFPNPSNGIFQVEMENEDFTALKGKTEIEIFDMPGKVIFRTALLDSHSDIDLSKQAQGIYFYRVINSNKIIGTGKLIVQ